jgi:hypothetical protein
MAVGADYSRDLIGGISVPSPAPNQSWPCPEALGARAVQPH